MNREADQGLYKWGLIVFFPFLYFCKSYTVVVKQVTGPYYFKEIYNFHGPVNARHDAINDQCLLFPPDPISGKTPSVILMWGNYWVIASTRDVCFSVG